METTTYKISDIGEVVGGGTPSTANSDFWGGDIPWISPKDLTGYKSVYISHGENFLTKTGLKSGTKLLPKGTVLFSSRAPIGYVAIASNPICTNQGFKSIICNKEIINPLFLYYYIKGNLDYIKLFGTGATFPEISGAAMRKIKVQIPSIPTQQKIASILSAYDRLIENNTRRIRLLEQMAENLYKEWFVRFRFPKHENVEMINGLPKGWNKKELGNIADVCMGSSPKSEYYNDEKRGLPFHQGVGSFGERFVLDNTYSTSYSQIAEPMSILFSVRAPVGRLNYTRNRIVIGRGVAAINHKEGMQSLLFYTLKAKFFKEDIIGNGAIFSSITKKELLKLKLIVANKELRVVFNNKINKIDREIDILYKQNQLLNRQRDLLLPRLMSGKLEVKS